MWPLERGKRGETPNFRSGSSAGTRTARGGSRQNCKCVVATRDEGLGDREQVQRACPLRPERVAPRHNSPAAALCEAGKQLLLQQEEEPQQAAVEWRGTNLRIWGAPAQLSANNRIQA